VTVASAHGPSGSAECGASLGSGGDRATFALVFPRDSAVLVAGVPGAGKTTLLHRVAGDGAERLDSDDIYALVGARPGLRAFLRPLVHLLHHVRIHLRLRRRGGAVLVHETGTRRLARRAIARSARRGGHPPHLLVLDVPRDLARAGQLERKRAVRDAVLDRHIARLRPLRAEPAGIAKRDGFASVILLSREEANRLTAVRFAT
jgi:predicted kinase